MTAGLHHALERLASARRGAAPGPSHPREIPIDGEPADVAAVITRNGEWLAKTPEVPKLLLTFEGTGLSNTPAVVEWARSAFPKLDVVPLGSAGHHAPENAPKEIEGAITSWLDRHALK